MIKINRMLKLNLLLATLFIIFGISQPNTASAQMPGIPDYKTSWQATNYMTVDFPAFTDWSRTLLALGPASWTVTYKTKQSGCTSENSPTCYSQVAHENWSIIDPSVDDCYANVNLNCNGSNMNRAKWLWATGGCLFQDGSSLFSACGTTGINAWDPTFDIRPIEEAELYRSNNTSGRGDGPGVVWEPNNNGTTAIWAQGPYGYAQGGIDQTTNRAGINVVGTMIPLRWQVEGFND